MDDLPFAVVDQTKMVPSKDYFMCHIVVSDSSNVIKQMQKYLDTSTPFYDLNPSRFSSLVPPNEFENVVQSIMCSPSFFAIQPPTSIPDLSSHCRFLIEQQLLVYFILLDFPITIFILNPDSCSTILIKSPKLVSSSRKCF